MIIKLAFSGKQRSGKDTAAQYVIKKLKNHFRFKNVIFNSMRIGLADEVKRLCSEGLNRDDRDSLQKFGTEVIRKGCKQYFDTEDFWVNIFLYKVKNFIDYSAVTCILCTDVRFPNEVKRLQADGFKVVRLEVKPDQQVNRADGKEVVNLDHESETALDNYKGFDWVIPPCDLKGLYQNLDYLIGEWYRND